MVNVLASSVENCFKQNTKEFVFSASTISTQYLEVWLVWNRDSVRVVVIICLWTVVSPSYQNLTCSRHDIGNEMLILCLKTISYSLIKTDARKIGCIRVGRHVFL
jgi:hypothetical protein